MENLKTLNLSRASEHILYFLICALLLFSPFIYLDNLYEFANLPQEVFIQTAVVIVLIVLGINILCKKILPIPINISAIFLALYLSWTFFSFFWAHNCYESFLFAVHLLICSIVYLILSTFPAPDIWKKRFVISLLLACTGVGLIGCAQQLFYLNWYRQVGYPAATFGNRTMAAEYISMVLPVLMGMFFYYKKKSMHILLLTSAIVLLIYLYFSKNRASWVAVLFSLSFVGISLYKDSRIENSWVKISRKTITVAVFFSSMLIISSFIFYPSLFSDFIKDLKGSIVHMGYRTGESTISIRFNIWRNSLEMVKDRPILGYGAGNFKLFYPLYHQKAVKDNVFSESKQPQHVHNDFIENTVEFGLMGGLLFIGLLLSIFLLSHRVISLKGSPESRVLVISFSGSIVSFITLSMFSFPLHRAITPVILFFSMGMISSLYAHDHGKGEIYPVKVDRRTTALILIILILSGFFFIRFNICRLIADKYLNDTKQMEQREDWDRVVSYGLSSLKYNPYDRDALSAVGLGYAKIGRTQKAIEMLSQVVDRYPYHINALINLGVAYKEMGDKVHAVEAFERVLEIKPDYLMLLIDTGTLCIEIARYTEALFYFQKAVAIDQNNPMIHANLGFLMLKKNIYSKAADEYERVLKIKPEMVFAHKNLGLIYYNKLHEPEKAFWHMRKYIELQPDDSTSDDFRKILSIASPEK